jgi:pyridoxamine 5'-phosphate oxidase
VETERVLIETEVDPSPFRQFDTWYRYAIAQQVPEPTAMTLATSTRDGIPSARVVLLKAHDARGFVFYTNYSSLKGRDLAENPRASLVFFWPTLERQIRIVGAVAKVPAEESEAYFRTRPRASQIGAWASAQSSVLGSRADLEQRAREVDGQYKGVDVPLPPFWGGYRLTPTSLEFWQGRESRLHDRLRYTRRADGTWRLERLSP